MTARPFAARQLDADPVPTVWVLHDGKAGMANQALGVAEATGFEIVDKRLDIRAPWRHLPPQLWPAPLRAISGSDSLLAPPWPDLVIGCGRNAVRPAMALRAASGGRMVAGQIQDPHVGRNVFDLLVVPEHDRWRGPNVLVTRGAVHRVTDGKLAQARVEFAALAALPRPIIAVLIGGSNKSFRLTEARLREIGRDVAAILHGTGGAAIVTPSRRTGEAGVAILREALSGLPAQIWDGDGPNPYMGYLAFADSLLVTADSVSMVSEAAATGKPVHILDLPGGNAKFARFHAAMRDAGITRRFAGRLEDWTYPIPDGTARAGAALRQMVLDRRLRVRGAPA